MQRLGKAKDRERGAAGVLVAVMMVVLIGAGALAVDTGQIYAERAQLQNAADAGALAGADLCSVTGGCTQAQADAVAAALANSNSNDNSSTVQSVDLSVPGEVSVTTSTKNGTTNAGFLSKMFASALNAPAVTVGATATAKWLYPTKGVTVLPLTFAPCEFKDDGLPHKILTQGGGGGATDCNGLNPSNQIIPGGFAWLDPDGTSGCKVTAEVGEWSATSAGAAVPNGCIDLFNPSVNPSLANSTVALPVYKYTCAGMPAAQFGSCLGSSVQYFIEKWAGFKIQAWNLGGQAKYDPTNVFGGSEKGLYGTFVGYSADPSLFTGGTTTPTGNVVVLGLIK
ncbi:pilus assembly protein TadG-related protein [Arthrobacter sp. AD-310]